jgi:FOG: HEAT repeat
MIDIDRIYKELENAGVNTAKYNSLLAISEPYPKAIPVFIDFLQNEEFDSIRTKEMLVRTLTVKGAKGLANETFVSEYHKYPEEGLFESYRWAIGNAFTVIITSKDEGNIIDIVSNKNNGKSRQMFVYALKAIKSIRVENTLIDLLNDSDVTGHAIYALGSMKSQKAKAKIEFFLNNKSAYIRRNAKTALRKIG